MTERWKLLPEERDRLRNVIGLWLLGPKYRAEEPLIKQLAELRGQNGPILARGFLGFLASPQTPEKPKKEEFPMPEDFAGGPEEWAKLSEAEKRAIHEALKAGRKTYLSKYVEESKRGTLDYMTLEKQRLQKILNTNW